jgi:pyridoxine 5-phosphate synthase
VALNGVQLKPVVRTLRDAGILVSVFVDPVLEQVKAAHKVDAGAIEINTAAYSEAPGREGRATELRRVVDAARIGRKLGLGVHAGHGLDYHNVGAVAAVAEISELNIGHSIVSRAVLVGLERAVREMAAAMAAARRTD